MSLTQIPLQSMFYERKIRAEFLYILSIFNVLADIVVKSVLGLLHLFTFY